MSLNDKIVEIFEKSGSLSTEDVRRILEEHYGIKKSLRTVQRHIVEQLVDKEGILVPDKPRGREQTYSLAKKIPESPGARASLWDRLKDKMEQVGGNLLDLTINKCTLSDTRDPITGWRKKCYDTKSSIKGIMILKGALELIATAGIYMPPEYAAVVLTADPIEVMDRLCWKEKLYEVEKVGERYDGYNLSYWVAHLRIVLK